MKFLVQFGSCVYLVAFAAFSVPVQAQPSGWYGGGGAGFWMTGYAPPVPLFGANPGYCSPVYSVPSPMAISTASYGGDACCAPQCCDPCGVSCGTGCASGSCAGCEPGTGSLKPNADENFRRKTPSEDTEAEEFPRDRSRNRDRELDRRRTNEPAGDGFRGSRGGGRTPGGSGSEGGADKDFPDGLDGSDLLNPDGAGSGDSGTKPSGSGTRSDTNADDGLFDLDPVIETRRPPMTEPEADGTTDATKSGASDPAGRIDDFGPSGTEGKPDGVAPTGDDKDFVPPEDLNGAEKRDPSARSNTDDSPSGPRIAGVTSQLREVIPFTRLAVTGQGSADRRLSDTTSARPASRWISVPMPAGHARL